MSKRDVGGICTFARLVKEVSELIEADCCNCSSNTSSFTVFRGEVMLLLDVTLVSCRVAIIGLCVSPYEVKEFLELDLMSFQYEEGFSQYQVLLEAAGLLLLVLSTPVPKKLS